LSPVEIGGTVSHSLIDDARELATSVRDRARNAFAASRAQTKRSDEMRVRNQALKNRVAERNATRAERR
jgi:hypothetical protein